MHVITNIITSPEAVAAAVSNPGAVVEGVKQQAATVARGAEVLRNDPAKAAAILNDNPRDVGRVLGEVAGTAGMAAGAKAIAKTISAKRPDTIYRAVSEQEFKDISTTSKFRSEPGGHSMEGKFFAENATDARKWGHSMQGEGNYRVVRARVARTVLYESWDRLDRIGPARFYEEGELPKIRYKGEVL